MTSQIVNMELLTLSGSEVVRVEGYPGGRLDYEIVHGIRAGDYSLDLEYRKPRKRRYAHRDLWLPAEMAARLWGFAGTYLLRRERNYDCHSFMRYIVGWDAAISLEQGCDFRATPVDPDQSVALAPYTIIHQGQPLHSMIGYARGMSLNVFGPGGRLGMARNRDLQRVHGGQFCAIERA